MKNYYLKKALDLKASKLEKEINSQVKDLIILCSDEKIVHANIKLEIIYDGDIKYNFKNRVKYRLYQRKCVISKLLSLTGIEYNNKINDEAYTNIF